MGRHNGGAQALATALALVALAAGCGDDSPAESERTDADPRASDEASRQHFEQGTDEAAKANARNLASAMEVCFVTEQSYDQCTLASDGTVGGEPTGLAEGNAGGEISSTGTDVGYVIKSKSESGNTFVITKAADGRPKRTCTTKGRGGCPSKGPSAGNDW